jgi:hypothetical protein
MLDTSWKRANNTATFVSAVPYAIPTWEVSAMTWETPTFVEVKMDAEINSYQEESDSRF